jgi:RimJ/RimL family protein N-acetyltransferase
MFCRDEVAGRRQAHRAFCAVPFGPVLTAERVVLRAPIDADLEARRALGLNAEIRRMFGATNPSDAEMTVEHAEAWFATLGPEGSIEWVVEHSGTFLGVARLHSFEDQDMRARYAVGFFDPAQLGQGLGRTVTRLVLQYAFGELGLVEVEVLVLDFNERAQGCYRSCGFQEVERLPSGVMDGGRPAFDIRMTVTPATLTS